MSHPNPSHDRANEYPEDKVTHYPAKQKALHRLPAIHAHHHNKGGLVGSLRDIMATKHFGVKHGARHAAAKTKALKKAKGEDTSPF